MSIEGKLIYDDEGRCGVLLPADAATIPPSVFQSWIEVLEPMRQASLKREGDEVGRHIIARHELDLIRDHRVDSWGTKYPW